MQIQPFKLERYFARYEFNTKYTLTSSDCDGLSLPEVLAMADDEGKHMWESLSLGYTQSQGMPQLREAIAKLYSGLSMNDVLVTAPVEGIFVALNAILENGDHIICTAPGYQSFESIAESIGCEVSRWLPDEAKNWELDTATLKQLITPKTKLLIINFPHNPTGYIPSVERFTEILEIAKDHNLYVFSDEMYHFLEFDCPTLPPACDLYYKAVSLFGMSKTFGLAGLRIGWLATKNAELYQKMETFKDFTTICNSAPSEVLALISLRAKDKIIEKHLTRIKRNVNLLDGFFTTHNNLFSWVKPKAGTIGFPKLREDINADDFCTEAVTQAGIILLPSTLFDYDNKHFRVGFGRENLPEVLGVFEAFLQHKI